MGKAMLDILVSSSRDYAHKKNLIARGVAPREKGQKYTFKLDGLLECILPLMVMYFDFRLD